MFVWKEARETFPLVLLSLVAMVGVSQIRWSGWRIEFFEIQYWAVVFLCLSFIIPFVGAGAIAGERESRTLEFLLSRPVSPTRVYLIKYLVRLVCLILLLSALLVIFMLIRPTRNLNMYSAFKGSVIFFSFLMYMLSISFLFSAVADTPSKAFASTLIFFLASAFIINLTPLFRFAWLWRDSIDDLWLKYLFFYGVFSFALLFLGAFLSTRNAGAFTYEWKHIGVAALLLLLLLFKSVSITFWLIPRIAASGDIELLRLARQPLNELLVEASTKEERISGFLTDYLVSTRSGQIDRELVMALKHQDPNVRKKAIELLIARENRGVHEEVTALLDDPDVSVRHMAILCMQNFKSPGAEEKLTALLNDPNSSIRERAARALAEIEGKAAARKLLPLLHDSNPRVMEAAIYWLGAFDYTEAQPEIVRLLREHPLHYIRESAAEALRRIRSKPACGALIQALADENYRVSASAAKSIGTLRCEDAIQPLLQLLTATPAQQLSAIFALGRIKGPEAETALKDLFSKPDAAPLIKQEVAFALADMGDDEALQYLRTQLKMAGEDSKTSGREYAIRLCGAGDYYAIPFLISYLDAGYPIGRFRCGQVLTRMTGKNYGWDSKRWTNWWNKDGHELAASAPKGLNGGE